MDHGFLCWYQGVSELGYTWAHFLSPTVARAHSWCGLPRANPANAAFGAAEKNIISRRVQFEGLLARASRPVTDRSPARASRTSRSPPAATRHFLPLATTWLTTHPVIGESAPVEELETGE